MDNTENNKMIAEFMGTFKGCDSYGHDRLMIAGAPIRTWKVHVSKYHTSWDWLMPVWLKIMQWGVNEYGVQWRQEITEACIKFGYTKATGNFDYCDLCFKGSVTISDVYKAITEFIKWYNLKSNNQ
jgi:hypothetical protein